jgi:signal transduction histidine kinase
LNFDQQVHLVNPGAEAFLSLPLAGLKGHQLNQIDAPLAMHLSELALWQSELWNGSSGQRLRCHHGEFNDRGFLRSYYLIEDVTQELQQSERDAYEKLIRMVSHEVNNTVAATNSLLQSCQHYASDLSGGDKQDFIGAIDVLITRNRHLNEFTHRLADIARIPEPDKQLVKLHDLVEPIVTIFRPACTENNIELKVYIDKQLPAVSLDQSLLEQVLINIVKNALEALSKDGIIAILAKREKHQIKLTVKDNGGGLDKEAKDHLFQPFYTSKPTGQGLGLTLAKDILNLHEFSYRLDGNSQETQFDITIPSRFFNGVD